MMKPNNGSSLALPPRAVKQREKKSASGFEVSLATVIKGNNYEPNQAHILQGQL